MKNKKQKKQQKNKQKQRHKTSKKKLFLVSNYRIFRGLEHLKITVSVECDKYFFEHYLLETFARYTKTLFLVIFQNNKIKQRYDLIFKKKKNMLTPRCNLGTPILGTAREKF